MKKLLTFLLAALISTAFACAVFAANTGPPPKGVTYSEIGMFPPSPAIPVSTAANSTGPPINQDAQLLAELVAPPAALAAHNTAIDNSSLSHSYAGDMPSKEAQKKALIALKKIYGITASPPTAAARAPSNISASVVVAKSPAVTQEAVTKKQDTNEPRTAVARGEPVDFHGTLLIASHHPVATESPPAAIQAAAQENTGTALAGHVPYSMSHTAPYPALASTRMEVGPSVTKDFVAVNVATTGTTPRTSALNPLVFQY